MENNRAQKLCTNCIAYQVSDKPNKLAGLGWRVVFATLSWWCLGLGLTEGDAFFVSIAMYIIPLLVEYISFTPKETYRNIFRWFQIIVCIIFGVIAFLGISDGITVANIDNNLFIIPMDTHIILKGLEFKLNLLYVYYPMAWFVISSFIEWLIAPRVCEEQYAKAFGV